MATTMFSSARIERIEKFVNKFVQPQGDDPYETRRDATRYTMNEPVDLLIDSHESPADMILASGRDISSSGIGLYSNRPVKPGTEMLVSVNTGREKFLSKAVAVHSTLSVGLFKVGARFTL